MSEAVRRRPGAPAGIYIHIPFCSKLCPYCDFAVSVRREIPHETYADAVIREFSGRVAAGEFEGRRVGSVYLGGGTPSLLAPDALGRIVRELRGMVELNGAEWTLEANPLDVDERSVERWVEMGFGRVSLGVQSFCDDYLARLGRLHDGARALSAARLLIESSLAASIDLIFGGPSHGMSTWTDDIDRLADLGGLGHVSAYHLTVEANTVFARRYAEGDLDLPREEVATEMLEVLRDRCAALGLEQYEVSSYAAPGRRSVHNGHYWQGAEYVGVGVGAHGLRIGESVVRTSNPRRLKAYLSSPVGAREIEVVEPRLHLAERLFTGVRSAHGLRWPELEWQFEGAVAADVLENGREAIDRVVAAGWMVREGESFIPTEQGYLFADSAGAILFEAVAP